VGERLLEVEHVALANDLVLVGLLAVLRIHLVLKQRDVRLGRELAKGGEALRCSRFSIHESARRKFSPVESSVED